MNNADYFVFPCTYILKYLKNIFTFHQFQLCFNFQIISTMLLIIILKITESTMKRLWKLPIFKIHYKYNQAPFLLKLLFIYSFIL